VQSRRKIALSLLNCGGSLMMLGGLGDVLVALAGRPPTAWNSLGLTAASMPANVVRLLLALLTALGCALIASGFSVVWLVNGPLRRGEKRAATAIAVIAVLSDGMNAFAIFRLHLWYFCIPLSFVALVLAGLALTRWPSRVFPADGPE